MRLLFSKSGFSLVEILVTVAVIAVLVAILMPVAGSLRQSGWNARCVENLRVIEVAVKQYASDHNGEYPPAGAYNTVYSKPGTPLSDMLQSQKYLQYGNQSQVKYGDNPAKGAGPWFCPADTTPLTNGRAYYNASYGQNLLIGADDRVPGATNPGWVSWQTKPTTASNTAHLIYLIDVSNGAVFASAPWPLWSAGSKTPPASRNCVSFRHGSGSAAHANALFLDGSVRPMTYSDLADTTTKYLSP